jgi:hypothetical protein
VGDRLKRCWGKKRGNSESKTLAGIFGGRKLRQGKMRTGRGMAANETEQHESCPLCGLRKKRIEGRDGKANNQNQGRETKETEGLREKKAFTR